MPLTYHDRGTSETRLDVMSRSVVVGSIWKEFYSVMAGGEAIWYWSLHTPTHVNGSATSREDAKAGIEQAWKDWLEAAGLNRGPPGPSQT